MHDNNPCCGCLKQLNTLYVDALKEGCGDNSTEKRNLDRYVELEKMRVLSEKCDDTISLAEIIQEQHDICLGVIPESKIYGCTDVNSLLYNANATHPCVENGVVNGCCNPSTGKIYGCTDPTAYNYNVLADIDDGSCIYCTPGCTDPAATNYNPAATCSNNSCLYPPTNNICQVLINTPLGELLMYDVSNNTTTYLETISNIGIDCAHTMNKLWVSDSVSSLGSTYGVLHEYDINLSTWGGGGVWNSVFFRTINLDNIPSPLTGDPMVFDTEGLCSVNDTTLIHSAVINTSGTAVDKSEGIFELDVSTSAVSGNSNSAVGTIKFELVGPALHTNVKVLGDMVYIPSSNELFVIQEAEDVNNTKNIYVVRYDYATGNVIKSHMDSLYQNGQGLSYTSGSGLDYIYLHTSDGERFEIDPSTCEPVTNFHVSMDSFQADTTGGYRLKGASQIPNCL